MTKYDSIEGLAVLPGEGVELKYNKWDIIHISGNTLTVHPVSCRSQLARKLRKLARAGFAKRSSDIPTTSYTITISPTEIIKFRGWSIIIEPDPNASIPPMWTLVQ